jgi:hypothetical protein
VHVSDALTPICSKAATIRCCFAAKRSLTPNSRHRSQSIPLGLIVVHARVRVPLLAHSSRRSNPGSRMLLKDTPLTWTLRVATIRSASKTSPKVTRISIDFWTVAP